MLRYCVLLILVLEPSAAADKLVLKVAAVQFRSTFNVADNAARMAKTLGNLVDRQIQVAVFPECALTGYHTRAVMEPTTDEVRAAEETVSRTCRERRIAAVFGSVWKSGPHTYDTAVVFNSKGELVERYGKLIVAGEKWATPGNHIALFDLEGIPSTVIICHDERFPEFVRLPAMAGARLVYYISHEAGMQKESKLPGYRAQMVARAVENGVFVVAANAPGNVKDNSGSHGQSRIIKDDGNILQEASIYGEDILVESLEIPTAMPVWIQEHLKGLTGSWWKQGLESLLKNRNLKLE
jgi:predicted amidohydrolase